ncbi:thioredoxin domain-containing protein [uncultured Methanospirillum sp.]|uniref:thioredoxin domain-containing protein n=1 Tax=uncultured Methanospirillum sp. TaxID=262503 RepID=UPI0029C66D5E|nr:thioredoxin domain-containing protein [uncultured Methanospirillum sp.]
MPNRLIHEQSPYLLQHAYNPVDWYPWGEEAHALARERDLPVFLSIGYAACHWCHVMEKECFIDQEVAELLNKFFVSIKVDREEHPEIDRIYMAVCQAMTGSGGWPLSIFLTPDLKPFYSATFIPKRSRGKTPGMLDLIPHIVRVWNERRDEIYEAGAHLLGIISHAYGESSPLLQVEEITDEEIHSAFRSLASTYDPEFGGYGRGMKFPSVPQLIFLMNYGVVFGHDQAIRMATDTLSSMALGGIRDQIGFGFHRYSVDRAWNAPHFEKMLYDQAMNTYAYTVAWQITGDPMMRNAAEESVQYITHTLRRQGGGFASAEDADSQGGEGAFYLWKLSELMEILTSDELALAEKAWGITEKGNLPPEAGFSAGSNIISWIREKNAAGNISLLVPQDSPSIKEIRKKLFTHREMRPRPLLDDKVLTDWNGLAIWALAYTGRVLGDEWMISAAEDAAAFLLTSIRTEEGKLWHQWKAGTETIPGTAQDYIFFVSGLVGLFQATGKPSYLESAVTIIRTAIDLFWDEKKGGFYCTRSDDPLVPVRIRDDYDGAVPSVNGAACQALKDLGMITGSSQFTNLAETLLNGMHGTITRVPQGTLSLLGSACTGKKEIRAVITGDAGDERRIALWRALHQRYIPGLVVVPLIPAHLSDIKSLIPESGIYAHEETPTVWICAGETCRPPVSDPESLSDLLTRITHS